jgi:hypothetical protein
MPEQTDAEKRGEHPLPNTDTPWVDPKTGKPTPEFLRWAWAMDRKVKQLTEQDSTGSAP